jgi:hypothetical protein
MTELLGVTGHGFVEDFAHLTLQGGVLVDEIAAVAAERLHLDVEVGERHLGQSEAERGGAKLSRQIGVVGFITWIGGLPELAGGVWMDEPDVVACVLPKGTQDRSMVSAGHLDGDDEIFDLFGFDGLSEDDEGMLDHGLGVFDPEGREEDFAVEVGEGELGPGLGGINDENAEVLRTDLLHTGREGTQGLEDLKRLA